MNRALASLLLLFMLAAGAHAQRARIWKQTLIDITESPFHPLHYSTFTADEDALRAQLTAVPTSAQDAAPFLLPLPGGGTRLFRIWQTPAMDPMLAAKYPLLHTYTAIAADAPAITAKLDITPEGFHAYIFDGAQSYLIDPVVSSAKSAYIVYFKSDYSHGSGEGYTCLTTAVEGHLNPFSSKKSPAARVYGETFKSYRLALAADSEYCAAVDGPAPTKAGVLARMLTTLNRVNGVYERDLSLTMVLIAAEDTLIFLNNSPYSNASGSAMMAQNQAVVTARIGTANYDIGHVFSTAAGGIAETGSVCQNGLKARGVTGRMSPVGDAFDIDFVAHEMGHQYGASHTFNAGTGPCWGNGVPEDAFEPGSGSTIMAYAGICGSGNDFQEHSDDYFHSKSLEEITDYITTPGEGGTCPLTTPSAAGAVTLPAFAADYFIPFKTPFELTAPAVQGDSITYCWEERDLGDIGASLADTRLSGPLFRSFHPTDSPTRIFPAPEKLVRGVTNYEAEKLPDTSRTLRFGLTARAFSAGRGRFNFPDDRISLSVVRTEAPFTVSAPSGGETLSGGSIYTIRWAVSGTDATPISCALVDIYLSVDSGYTFPVLLKSATPNDGAETLRIPNPVTTSAARIKVKAHGNVFFNLNTGGSFTLLHSDGVSDRITISPVPAVGTLHVYIPEELGVSRMRIMDVLGRTVWDGTASGDGDLSVAHWARGLYYVQVLTPGGITAARTLVLR